MRIVIAEDSVLLREGLTRLLAEAGHEVVAGAGDAGALLAAVEETGPDLAVIDVRLPPGQSDEGIRAALALHRTHPELALLILSQYVEETYAAQLLAQATTRVGYLLKERIAHVGEFLDAVRRVGDGGTALDPEVVAQLLARRRTTGRFGDLTPREQEVLALMAQGHSNAAIAARLVITEGAVEKHITSVFARLGLADTGTWHRRVLAVLTYLGQRPRGPG
jgi:DNA-binding NarL/FixJ family response regulator